LLRGVSRAPAPLPPPRSRFGPSTRPLAGVSAAGTRVSPLRACHRLGRGAYRAAAANGEVSPSSGGGRVRRCRSDFERQTEYPSVRADVHLVAPDAELGDVP